MKHILIHVTEEEFKRLTVYKARHGITWGELILEAIEPCEPEDVL